MKKILTTLIIVLLFIFSALIYWFVFSPQSFLVFFSHYPIISKVVTKLGIIGPQYSKSIIATSSEMIASTKGQVIINNNTITVEIVTTDADRANGLSNKSKLNSKEGMLFGFAKMSYQAFGMKEMLFPIDMIFFDENWQVVLIESNVEPRSYPKIFGASVKSQYVLEINAGEAVTYGLKVGDQVIFVNQ